MSDVKCPYCGLEQEINHDDGYGYEEGRKYEQECECGKTFVFYTSISFNYEAHCQDGDHKMVEWGYEWPGMYGCENCEFCELRNE